MIFLCKKIIFFFDRLLMQPLKVFILVFCVLFFSLLFDESLFKVSSLYHRLNFLKKEVKVLKTKIKNIDIAQSNLKDPKYVEFLVKDRLNWSKEKELLFLFIDPKTNKNADKSTNEK